MGLMRFFGIMLPWNGRPVVGSKIVTGCPFTRVCEKSPERCSAVGTVGGAAVGGLIGNQVGKGEERREERR